MDLSREKLVKYTRGWRTAGFIFLIFFIVLILWIITKQLYWGFASSRWPYIAGQITRSEIETRWREGTRKTYWPMVQYSYEISGRRFIGNTIFFVQDGHGLSWAKRKIAYYKPGRSISVYYDPENIQRSVLEPGISLLGILLTVIGVSIFLLILGGLSFLCFWASRYWKKKLSEIDKLTNTLNEGF